MAICLECGRGVCVTCPLCYQYNGETARDTAKQEGNDDVVAMFDAHAAGTGNGSRSVGSSSGTSSSRFPQQAEMSSSSGKLCCVVYRIHGTGHRNQK